MHQIRPNRCFYWANLECRGYWYRQPLSLRTSLYRSNLMLMHTYITIKLYNFYHTSTCSSPYQKIKVHKRKTHWISSDYKRRRHKKELLSLSDILQRNQTSFPHLNPFDSHFLQGQARIRQPFLQIVRAFQRFVVTTPRHWACSPRRGGERTARGKTRQGETRCKERAWSGAFRWGLWAERGA